MWIHHSHNIHLFADLLVPEILDAVPYQQISQPYPLWMGNILDQHPQSAHYASVIDPNWIVLDRAWMHLYM